MPLSRRRRTLRRLGWSIPVLILLAALGWLVATGLLARQQASAAQHDVGRVKSSMAAGDLTAAERQAADLAGHAHRAHRLTTGPAWWLAGKLPWLGRPAVAVRGCTAQLDALSAGVLSPLVQVAGQLSGSSLVDHGSVRLPALAAAAPVLDRAQHTLASASDQVDALPARTWLSPVDRTTRSFRSDLTTLRGQLDSIHRVSTLLPRLLGADGKQRYFVGLENEAESRGLGGIPGAFVIATADHGRLAFERYESDTALVGVRTGLDLGPEYQQRYRGADPANTYQNSTISPDFSDAARIWAAMWQAKSGERVDGAIAIDPTALSYLLTVTGPAHTAGGEQITANTVVPLTQKTLYQRYPDTARRKAELIDIATGVAQRLLTAHGSPDLVRAALKGAAQRRLLVWSADPAVEGQLRQTSFGGVLVPSYRPFAGFTTVNATGGKLDYYLHRTMSYQRTGCGSAGRSVATFTIDNDAPDRRLPSYVTLRADHPGYPTKPGDDKVLVSYYGTPGARITAVTVNGRPTIVAPGTEHGLTVFTLPLELPRGASSQITVTAAEPPTTGSVQLLKQPAVQPVTVTVREPSCG